MGELPKQWLAWLAKLLPQQKVQGDNAVQVGKVNGGLHTDHSTHSSTVHVTHVTTHQHFYAVAATPAQAPATDPAAANDGARLTPEQREVFALMKRLERRTYNQVLAFMRREFDTGLVHQLQGPQLYRVRRYVETIQLNDEQVRA